MPSKVLEDCSALLMDKKLTVSFAESATAGRVIAEFSLIPHCGKVITGSLVCYDAGIKQDILEVPYELVERYTPESAEVTEAMAKGLKDFIKSDIQVAVTGLTMPGGSETAEKPVGTMFVHTIYGDKAISERRVFSGIPEEIVLQTVDLVAETIINAVNGQQ
jgi:nicotinamide-nucleotide amidase